MGAEQASSVDEVISRSQGGAGVAPPASPGLLTINDLNARRSSNADGSESAASSSRSRPESPRTAGAAPALHTVALDLRSLLETHIASVMGSYTSEVASLIEEAFETIFSFVNDHLDYPTAEGAEAKMAAVRIAAQGIEGNKTLYDSAMGRVDPSHYRAEGFQILMDRVKERTKGLIAAQRAEAEFVPMDAAELMAQCAAGSFAGECHKPEHRHLELALDEKTAEAESLRYEIDEAQARLQRAWQQISEQETRVEDLIRSNRESQQSAFETRARLSRELERANEKVSAIDGTEGDRKRAEFKKEFDDSVRDLIVNLQKWKEQREAHRILTANLDAKRVRDIAHYAIDSHEYAAACEKTKKLQDVANGMKASTEAAQKSFFLRMANITVDANANKARVDTVLKLPKTNSRKEVTNSEMISSIMEYIIANPHTYFAIFPFVRRTLKDRNARKNAYWLCNTEEDIPDEMRADWKAQSKVLWEKLHAALSESSLVALLVSATSDYVPETNAKPIKANEYDGVALCHAIATLTNKEDRATIERTNAALRAAPREFATKDPAAVVASQRELLATDKRLEGQCKMTTSTIKSIMEVLIKRNPMYQDVRFAWSEKGNGQLNGVEVEDALPIYGRFLAELEDATRDIQKGKTREGEQRMWRANALTDRELGEVEGLPQPQPAPRAKAGREDAKRNNAKNSERYCCDVLGCNEKTKFFKFTQDGTPRPKPKGNSPVLCDNHRRMGLNGTFAKLKNGRSWHYNRDGDRPFPEYTDGKGSRAKAGRELDRKMQKMEAAIKSMQSAHKGSKSIPSAEAKSVQDRVNAMTTKEFTQWLSSQHSRSSNKGD